MLGVMCLVALLQLVRSFLLVLSVLVFSAYRLCVIINCDIKLVSHSTITMMQGPIYIRFNAIIFV